jgi:hypothetical protein
VKHIDSKYEPTIYVDKVIGQVLELLEFLTSLLKSTKSLFQPFGQECSLKVEWDAPEDGGSPITEYEVSIRRQDGQFEV